MADGWVLRLTRRVRPRECTSNACAKAYSITQRVSTPVWRHVNLIARNALLKRLPFDDSQWVAGKFSAIGHGVVQEMSHIAKQDRATGIVYSTPGRPEIC